MRQWFCARPAVFIKYDITMFTMMTVANKSAGIFSAIVSGVVSLLVSFWAFRWGLIHLWEWQHGGRRMMFVFDPEIKAAVMAIVLSVAVFVVLLWRSSRHSKA